VAYDGLPISSGGAHGLGRISARDAVSAWVGFLDKRTEASPASCWFDFPLFQALDPVDFDEEQALLPGQEDRACVPRTAIRAAIRTFTT
jgi:hypothetical protein